MCRRCYEEYGEPQPDNAARSVVPLLEAVGPFSDLHIVIDDWNIEDTNIAWCLAQDGISEIERRTGDALAKLTIDQRAAALAIYYNMIDPEPGDE